MASTSDTTNPCPITLRLLSSRLADRDFCPVLISTFRGVDIVRILSPEMGEPFVSASRLFLCCSLSPVEGLIRFNLQLPLSYDLSLGNLTPWDDIWVNLKTARRIARSLNVLDALEPLLDWSSKSAWATCEWARENTRVQLVQNWQARMCERQWSPFYKIDVSPNDKYTTMMDVAEMQHLRESTSNARERASMQAWEKVTLWSSFAYEEWRERKQLPNGGVNGVSKSRKADLSAPSADMISLQTAFPAMLIEATATLEQMIAASTPELNQIRSEHAGLDGDPLSQPNFGGRDRLQTVVALAASFGRMALRLRKLTAAPPESQTGNPHMREWLNQLPGPRSSPPERTLSSPSQPGASLAKISAERDALAQRLARMEKRQEKLLRKLNRQAATEERVRELEARLALLGGSGEGVETRAGGEPESGSDAPPSVEVESEDAEEDEEPMEPARKIPRRTSSPDVGRSHSPGSDSSTVTVRPASPSPPGSDVATADAKKRWRVSAWGALTASSMLMVTLVSLWLGFLGQNFAVAPIRMLVHLLSMVREHLM